jgi:hypothetical protein
VRDCEWCGGPLTRKFQVRFCSGDCFHEWRRKVRGRAPNYCLDCGEPICFRAKRCRVCASKERERLKNWPKRYCVDCGKLLTGHSKQSIRCRSCAMKRRFGDPEERRRVSERMRESHRCGTHSGDGWRRKIAKSVRELHAQGVYDCLFSQEVRERANEAIREHWASEDGRRRREEQSKKWSGPGNPGWRDGRYPPSPYPPEFDDELKFVVKQRDGFKCILCGEKEGLVVHHLDEDKQNNEIANLATLCRPCHAKIHHKEGFDGFAT